MKEVNPSLQALWGLEFTELMDREDITELYVNDDGYIRYQSYEEGKVKTTLYFEPQKIKAIIGLISGQNDQIADNKHPSISVDIPGYSARFQGELPPIVRNPQFNIRKRAGKIFTLEEYVQNGILPPYYKTYIEKAIANRKNILISGGTGTGKTTFLNAVLDAVARISPYHRIISLEDLPELQCPSDDYSCMFTMQKVVENGIEYNMTRLLKDCMRRSPDRIIVGEVRDGAAYTMLKAWNTGHPGGVSTTHADTAESALERIYELSLESSEHGGNVNSFINTLIGRSIDVVVSLSHVDLGNGRKGRVVNDIIEVDSYDEVHHKFILRHIPPTGEDT